MGGWGRVERPDAEVWFYDTGSDLPVVVLLHGLAGHALEWQVTIDALEVDHRVIAVEQRAHGSSTRCPDDVSPAAYVADVLAVLDDVRVEHAPLVGHSLGGQTALLVAATAPARVSSLVLVESGIIGEAPETTRAVSDWLASWPVPFADVEEFIGFVGGDPVIARAWAAGLQDGDDGLRPSWDAATMARVLAAAHTRELLTEWGEVDVATLLVRGEHGSLPDRQVDIMSVVRPEVTVRTIAGVGHDVHLQAPAAWIRVLRGWLAEHPS